jgi:hypothetical protein
MQPLPRLAAYAAALALIGAGAAAVGGATGATPPFQSCLDAAPAARAMPGESMGTGHGAAPMAATVPGADGTSAELSGLTLRPVRQRLVAGRAATWHFTISDCDGHAVRTFERDQTKLLHLIVARTDLTGYEHLHPTLGPDGRWSVDIDFAQPGRYRAIADFTTGGRRYVLGTTLVVPGPATPVALPPSATTATVDGYDVALRRPPVIQAGREAELTFEVTRDGRAVTDLEPYLGAFGHLVALHTGDLAYSHVHPVGESLSTGRITFDAELHKAGPYRLFLQFQTHGRVHTAAFTQEASR